LVCFSVLVGFPCCGETPANFSGATRRQVSSAGSLVIHTSRRRLLHIYITVSISVLTSADAIYTRPPFRLTATHKSHSATSETHIKSTVGGTNEGHFSKMKDTQDIEANPNYLII